MPKGKKGKKKTGKSVRRSHVKPEAPLIAPGQRGFWRLRHLLGYFGISASEYYRHAGTKYPKPHFYRGRNPIWRSEKF